MMEVHYQTPDPCPSQPEMRRGAAPDVCTSGTRRVHAAGRAHVRYTVRYAGDDEGRYGIYEYRASSPGEAAIMHLFCAGLAVRGLRLRRTGGALHVRAAGDIELEVTCLKSS
ncbi:MAG: hypothetical protein KatS3mg051_1594 [Anaerolineae bacterium]|nr:MAG: hypothetical protein KatS3mg051_1594 [Anaerolineae bacterium]